MGMNILEARRRVMMEQPHIETLVGNPVSFKAEALPLQELKVAITPVQDLHGQESPYPPGGGKNKWSGDATFSKSDDSLNVEVSISIQAGTYNLSGVFTSGDTTNNDVTFRFRSGSSTIVYVRPTANSGARTNVSFTPSSACDNVLVYGGHGVSASDKFSATYTDVMIENGSTATDYAPYANICPITGHTGVNVSRTGRNLIDGSKKAKAGASIYIGVTEASKPFATLPAGTYTVSVTMAGTLARNLYMKDFDTNTYITGFPAYIGYTDGSPAVKTFTLSKSTKLMFWSYNTSFQSVDDILTVKIEPGSQATAYTPYVGTVYPITWETAAGTVYGGTLDVLTGTLTVDRAIADLGDYNYIDVAENGVTRINENMNVIKWRTRVLCTQYQSTDQTNASNWNDCTIGVSNSEALTLLRIKDTRLIGMTTTQIRAALTGVKAVWELRTPVTYQLTAQQISSLLGMNNIWNDIDGDNTVSFYTH